MRIDRYLRDSVQLFLSRPMLPGHFWLNKAFSREIINLWQAA
jgi:hypothetical protein